MAGARFPASRASLHVRGRGRRDRVVAVQARDLLDEVLLDREVEPVRRRRDQEVVARALEGEAEPPEERGDRLVRNGDAEQPRDARRAHANGIAARQSALHVAHGPARPPQMSRISCVARSTARRQPPKSTPRSKR